MVMHEYHALELRSGMNVDYHRSYSLTILKQQRERSENFRPEQAFDP